MYDYKCKLDRVVDGGLVDVHIDLGFDTWLHSQRVRLMDIDAPPLRTLDPVEKVFGFASKQRVIDLLSTKGLVLQSRQFKGKFGRILGDFKIPGQDMLLTEILLEEGHAVDYFQDDALKEKQYLANRERLVESGEVVIPPDAKE